MTRHYCYVPGFGAFMMSEDSATQGTLPSIGKNSRPFYELKAPKRNVYFSSLHHHDDGVLANLLMEAEGMSYDDACRFIQRQASTLPADFSECASLHTDVDNFGFYNLQLEFWADLEKRLIAAQTPTLPTSQESTNTVTSNRIRINQDSISIPRYWVNRAAVSLLIAIFFFTDFIGLNRNNHQLASVINVEMLKRTVMVQSGLDEDFEELSMAEPTVLPVSLPEEDNSKTTTITSDQAEQPSSEVMTKVPSYFIVVASTHSETEAHRVCLRYLKQDYQTAGILSRDGLYRVFVNAFFAQDEATSYLREIRKVNERLSKAWMLTLKDASLSYNIKNIYNDNQLSMELSHPNKRSERDKG